METRKVVAGVHVLLAAVHIYWVTGLVWPAPDEPALSRAVLGVATSFAPQVVLPLAAVHLLFAFAVLRSDRYAICRLVVAGLAAGLAARAGLGLAWIFTGGGTAFYWLNLLLYTPACIVLCIADLSMLRIRWLKVAVVAGPVAMVTALALVAYVYQPAEQPHPTVTSGALSAGASRYVETRVARVHYLQQGSGMPVVLLAPGASPAAAWDAERAVLARSHTVYVVELPGQGETQLHDEHFAFDLPSMTDALGQFLDALHLQSVMLGGNSWSGGWGLAYAQQHPERVSKLLLLAPSGLDEPDVWSWEILKQPLVGEALAKLASSRSMVESAVRGMLVHKDRVTPQLVDEMWIPGTYRDNVRSMYALERGLDWSITERALPSTRQPTLVLWGDQDTVLPVAQAGRFGDLLPNATVHVLAGCGHALTVDCPDRVGALLAAFAG